MCPGAVLTDVSVWAGQSLYSAHRLVLALSSHYFRLVVTGLSGEGRHPVIFLKVGQREIEVKGWATEREEIMDARNGRQNEWNT